MSPGISTRLLATQSDERLLRLVREGHERAFEALVNRYRRPLLNYCRRLSLPEARTEDVLQQALLKTWIALRDGAEVRDIKAWLYRVVHNAAINAVRDAAYDRERVADPTLRLEGGQGDIERGLVVREALAEVAALPPLQREVIVRTAVGGHSHEQVASDLGLSDGAVRGLLYRARTTLRTATTVLTPPQLLLWLAGRADQGTGAPERLGELAAGGGGTFGLGGLLLKGGVAAVTAGTLITGAAVVHLQTSEHHRHPHPGVVAARGAATTSAAVGAAADVATVPGQAAGVPGASTGRNRRAAHNRDVSVGSPGTSRIIQDTTGGWVGRDVAVGRRRSVATAPGFSPGASAPHAPATTGAPVVGDSPAKSQGSSSTGASSGGPVGSEAGAGSPQGSGSGAGSEAPPSGGESAQTPSGSESESSTPAGGEESSGSSSSGGEQSGGLVKTVVHEVGSVVEHLLH